MLAQVPQPFQLLECFSMRRRVACQRFKYPLNMEGFQLIEPKNYSQNE